MTQSRARDALVSYGALLWARGLVYGTSGNISLRLEDGTLLVTPTQRSLRALLPSDIVHVGADGASLEPGKRATSELPLHLAAYRARGDIGCVVHTHPTHCVVWSKTGTLFPLDNVGARESLGTIAHTEYHPPGSRELADRCAAEFARGIDSVVMQDHGLSSVGVTLEDAFVRTDLAEECARLTILARLLGEATST